MRLLTLIRALLGLAVGPREILEIFGFDGWPENVNPDPFADPPTIDVEFGNWAATISHSAGGLAVVIEPIHPMEEECDECGATVTLRLTDIPLIRIPNGSSVEIASYVPGSRRSEKIRDSIVIRARWVDAIIRSVVFRRLRGKSWWRDSRRGDNHV